MNIDDKLSFLMCRPDFFGVNYVINPWMNGNVGRSDRALAIRQWESLYEILSRAADIKLIDPVQNLPDMVFTANAGLVSEKKVVLTHFKYTERQAEEKLFNSWFQREGFEVKKLPLNLLFEGAGDALVDSGGEYLFCAYGSRTSLETQRFLAENISYEIIPLRLTDNRFYHLDTCLLPLPEGRLLYYPDAFDNDSNKLLESIYPGKNRIIISNEDAVQFAANGICVGETIVMHRCSTALKKNLFNNGFNVIETDLSEFLKAGGSAKCLTLQLSPSVSKGKSGVTAVTASEVAVDGQLLDQNLLTQIGDMVVSNGGAFQIKELTIGQNRNEASRARIEIIAPNVKKLNRLMQKAAPLGAAPTASELNDAVLTRVAKKGVAPEDFYSTTIYKTQVRLSGTWMNTGNQRMDGVLVVAGSEVTCRLIRDLKVNDLVVTGTGGVRILKESKVSATDESFEFMRSGASSERQIEIKIERIAWEMNRVRERSGRIVFVPGPVVIHTGSGGHLAWMVRNGYVNALLGGNAVAVHDIEQALFGTSLGIDSKTGRGVERGHRNHIAAINRIRGEGSIRKAVKSGTIRSGLFYELVSKNIEFCLAGSIRDDGPLPDTEMDLIKAQSEYARLIKGADMIIMLSSMLHSIGTGNMTPGDVKIVCVDINPAVITKLSDRGSLETAGIVTDAGLFLSLLKKRLEEFSIKKA